MHHIPPIWQISFVLASAISRTREPVAHATHWHQRTTGPSLRAAVRILIRSDICQIGGMWCIKILLDDREEAAEPFLAKLQLRSVADVLAAPLTASSRTSH